jgi:nitroimidazol reductase NimA-like FMN-containing flavoprotein (pyridoxamine 5'-phosphate oxidase superfamily)
MRRKEKEIKSRERVEEILCQTQVGRLGTVSGDGVPMIKPVNFLYHKGRIYFHSAKEGEKIEHLASNPHVCFEVDEAVEYVPAMDSPCEGSFLYRSVILAGRARILDDPGQKIRILTELTAKYQPDARLRPLTENRVRSVAVVEIVADRITGKESRPKRINSSGTQT